MVGDGNCFHAHVMSKFNVIARLSKPIHRAHLCVSMEFDTFLLARIVTERLWRKDIKGMKIELAKTFIWAWSIFFFDGASNSKVSAIGDRSKDGWRKDFFVFNA